MSGPHTKTTYDLVGNVLSVTDPNQNTATFTYSPLNQQKTQEFTDGITSSSIGAKTTWTYDIFGNTTLETQEYPSSYQTTTSYTYDHLDRKIEENLPKPDTGDASNDHQSKFYYDLIGNLLSVESPAAVSPGPLVTSYEYDILNRRVATVLPDPDDPESTFRSTVEYDELGNQTSSTDALGRTTTFEYDALNRQTVTIQPHATSDLTGVGPKTVTTYDILGRGILATAPNGAQTAFEYDSLDRQTAIIAPDAETGSASGGRTEFTYDSFGNQETITDARDHVTTISYDRLNRKSTQVLPDTNSSDTVPGATTEWTYDGNGNVLTMIDPKDRATVSTYDGLDRLLTVRTINYNDSSDFVETSYQYDEITGSGSSAERQDTVTDALGRETVTVYDHQGRRIREILPDPDGTGSNGTLHTSPATEWAYDAASNVKTVTVSTVGSSEERVTEYEYDILGRQTKVTFPDPDTTDPAVSSPTNVFKYDAVGNLIQEQDALLEWTTYTYDNLNRQIQVTLPDVDDTDSDPGPTSTVEYDVSGNVVRETDAEGREVAYLYDFLNRQTHVITADPTLSPGDTGFGQADASPSPVYGVASETRYDLIGNVTATVDAAGRQTIFVYDELNRQVAQVLPDPVSGYSSYDDTGSTVNYTGLLATWEFDIVGNLVLEADAQGRETGYVYDYLDRQTKVIQGSLTPGADYGRVYATVTGGPAPQIGADYLVTEYDKVGNVVVAIEYPNSDSIPDRKTEYIYDNLNRRTKVILAQPDSSNQSTYGETTDSSGNPVGLVSESVYDDFGNVVQLIDAEQKVTTRTYDNLNRLKKETLPDPDANDPGGNGPEVSASTEYTYDANGNVKSEENAKDETTSYDYDELGRQIKVTDPNGDATEYKYDLVGNLTSLTDASDNETTYVYNALNQRLVETNELGKTRHSEYDNLGRLIETIDRAGRRTDFAYDGADRLISETWFADATSTTALNTIAWVYNDVGTVASVTDNSSSYQYTYDALDRLITKSNSGTPDAALVEFAYAYDDSGRLESRTQTVNGEERTTDTYEYDILNRLTAQSQTAPAGVNFTEKRAEFTYNNIGQYEQIVMLTGLSGIDWTDEVYVTEFGYDEAHRTTLIEHSHTQASSIKTVFASYVYDYDKANRVEKTTIDHYTATYDDVITFTYDDFGQLETANHTGTASNESYSYDDTGNRNGTGYDVGANNQTTDAPGVTFTYDDEGNRKTQTDTSDNSTVEYDWDHHNRLTTVTFKNSSGVVTKTVSYVYDSSNLRIAKHVDEDGNGSIDSTERYVLDNGHVLLQMDGAGSVQHEYMHGPDPDQILADEVFSDPAAVSEVLYPLSDNVGTVRDLVTYDELADATTVAHHREFDSFGKLLTPISDAHAFAFTGREFDADSNLQYSRNRWFDNSIGKFVSEDPMSFDAGDANITRYVFNNPITASDPSGLGFFSDLFDSVGDFFDDTGDFFEDAWGGFVENVVDPVENEFERFGHFVEDYVDDHIDFYEKHWENGNIQKALLAVSVVASGGAMAGMMAAGTLSGFAGFATTVQFASAAVSSYEVFSGDQIGDGTLSRVLGSAAAFTGGFTTLGPGTIGQPGTLLGNTARFSRVADGVITGVEGITGKQIIDEDIRNVLHGVNLATNVAPRVAPGLTAKYAPSLLPQMATPGTMPGATDRQISSRNIGIIKDFNSVSSQINAGIGLATGAASFINTGDPKLQRALRTVSIVSSVWQTGYGASQAIPAIGQIGGAIYDAGAAFVGGVRNAFARQQQVGYASLGTPGFVNPDPNARPIIRAQSPSGRVQQTSGSFYNRDDAFDDGKLNNSHVGKVRANAPASVSVPKDPLTAYVEMLYGITFTDPSDVFGMSSDPWLTDTTEFGMSIDAWLSEPVSFTAEYEYERYQQLVEYEAHMNAQRGKASSSQLKASAEAIKRIQTLSGSYSRLADPYSWDGSEIATAVEKWTTDSEFGVTTQRNIFFGTGLLRSTSEFVSSLAFGSQALATDPAGTIDAAWSGLSQVVNTSVGFGWEHGGNSHVDRTILALGHLSGVNGMADFAEGRDIYGNRLSYHEADKRGADGLVRFLNFLDTAGSVSVGAWKAAPKINRLLVKGYKPNILGSTGGNLFTGSKVGLHDLDALALEYAIQRTSGKPHFWGDLARSLNIDPADLSKLKSKIRERARQHDLIPEPARVNRRGVADFRGHTTPIVDRVTGNVVADSRVFLPETVGVPYGGHEAIFRQNFYVPDGFVVDHLPKDGWFQLVERPIHALTDHRGHDLWRTKVD